MRILVFLLVVTGSFMFVSCGTQRAIYNYVEDMTDTAIRKGVYEAEPIIQKNDLLSISIYSASLDPQVDALYNLNLQVNTGAQYQQQGFLVNQKGEIQLPRLGTLQVEGLTKTQLADKIKLKLRGLLTDPTVIVRFLNFRVIVIGQVGSPGVKTVQEENLTLLEALALAGDITEGGKKKEIKVLRENNGQRQLGIVDVTSSKMFQSPYYQLQQNDVIMVEATRYRIRQTEQARITQQIGFALSIITSIALLYNIFK
jgi:polysaccharide biosynthesis/export protein